MSGPEVVLQLGVEVELAAIAHDRSYMTIGGQRGRIAMCDVVGITLSPESAHHVTMQVDSYPPQGRHGIRASQWSAVSVPTDDEGRVTAATAAWLRVACAAARVDCCLNGVVLADDDAAEAASADDTPSRVEPGRRLLSGVVAAPTWRGANGWRTLLVLVNPAAGSGRAELLWKGVAAMVRLICSFTSYDCILQYINDI